MVVAQGLGDADRQAPRDEDPMMEGLGADSEEKHERMSDIDTEWWLV